MNVNKGDFMLLFTILLPLIWLIIYIIEARFRNRVFVFFIGVSIFLVIGTLLDYIIF